MGVFVDSLCSRWRKKPREGLFGEHRVGGCVLEGAPFSGRERVRFSGCAEEGDGRRGCSVSAQGEGTLASPGDSVVRGGAGLSPLYPLPGLTLLRLLGCAQLWLPGLGRASEVL